MSSSSSTHAVSAGRIEQDEAPVCAATSAPNPRPSTAADAQDSENVAKLPPLSTAHFREYNRMADHMDYFHNHFRQIWTMMYNACENKKRPADMSIRRFIDEGLQFINMLTMHHSIEESHIFPMLAQRMPEFQQPVKNKAAHKTNTKAAELVRQHRDIHKGMDAFEDYLRRCRNSETELELSVLKAQMDTWGKVLWQHLDEEVTALGAENMRRYWSLEEMKRMRM